MTSTTESALRKYLDLHNALHETLFALRVIETNLEEEAGVFIDAAKDLSLIDNTRLLGLAYMTKCMADQIERLMANHPSDEIA